MRTVELGHTGEQVSQLSLGCMIMGTRTDEPTSFELLDRYTDAGGNFLDTANCYCWWNDRGSLGGHSESLLGRWFARTGKRDQVFLSTKGTAQVTDLEGAWASGEPDWAFAYDHFDGAGAEVLRRSIDESLRRLRTDHVDLYYVHVDDRRTPLEETLAALAGIVQAGKARYIGWSNVRTWRLAAIRQLCEPRRGGGLGSGTAWPAPVALQQEYSYLRRRAGLDNASIVGDEQLDYLRAHEDLTLVAYSPILQGIYDDPARRETHFKYDSYRGPDAEARIAVLTELAGELGVTPNQLVLAWLLHHQPTVVSLIGPRTLEQYEAALPALDVKLTDDQLARLDDAGA
jgi:aryl-alcohol dehydrogenase-like predicted oxidoreductase